MKDNHNDCFWKTESAVAIMQFLVVTTNMRCYISTYFSSEELYYNHMAFFSCHIQGSFLMGERETFTQTK